MPSWEQSWQPAPLSQGRGLPPGGDTGHNNSVLAWVTGWDTAPEGRWGRDGGGTLSSGQMSAALRETGARWSAAAGSEGEAGLAGPAFLLCLQEAGLEFQKEFVQEQPLTELQKLEQGQAPSARVCSALKGSCGRGERSAAGDRAGQSSAARPSAEGNRGAGSQSTSLARTGRKSSTPTSAPG